MAIKNKDGTIYRLRGPNPLLKEQNRWKINEVQFFNFSWKDIVVPAKRRVQALPKFNIGKTEVIIKKEKEDILQIDLKEELPITPEIETKEPEGINKVLSERKTIFVCLPVRIKSYKDELYGDSYKTTTYGKKFTFEGVILERGGLGIRLWSPRLINQGSILCHDATDEFNDREWWKVLSVQEMNGGYILSTGISDYSPDMS